MMKKIIIIALQSPKKIHPKSFLIKICIRRGVRINLKKIWEGDFIGNFKTKKEADNNTFKIIILFKNKILLKEKDIIKII